MTIKTEKRSYEGPHWLLPSLAALVLWGFWAFLPKLAMQTMSPESVIFYEAIGNMFVAVPILFFLKGKLVRDKKGIMLVGAGSVIGMGALMAYYYALRLGPVATIVTLTSMYPVIVLLLARVFLKEKINRIQLFAAGMAMVAIALLVS